jgi:hypothetical protein
LPPATMGASAAVPPLAPLMTVRAVVPARLAMVA